MQQDWCGELIISESKTPEYMDNTEFGSYKLKSRTGKLFLGQEKSGNFALANTFTNIFSKSENPHSVTMLLFSDTASSLENSCYV